MFFLISSFFNVNYLLTAEMTMEKRPATGRDPIKGPTTCLHVVWARFTHQPPVYPHCLTAVTTTPSRSALANAR